MIIELLRYSDTGSSTQGTMHINSVFAGYTLEKPWRDNKRTLSCIPAGRYPLALRTTGGFHRRYEEKFPVIHKGTLEVMGVPDRTAILIHIGNRAKDTQGCILVGKSATEDFVGNSTVAYMEIYPRIAEALMNGEMVYIDIKDL